MTHFQGLIAATFTPMRPDGSLWLEQVPAIVDALVQNGVQGLYVCGSTGEGPSLSTRERCDTAAAYVEAAAKRIPVMIQVGHNSLADARALAEHASSIGADAISATPPTYFKPQDTPTLVDCLAWMHEPARDLPFFYYHIPVMTGIHTDVAELLPRAAERLPNLAGVKFSSPNVHEFTAIDMDRFTVLFGVDEMLLSGLAAGAHGAVGSTYNLISPIFHEVVTAFERGAVEEAQAHQRTATRIIRRLVRDRSLPGLKAAMGLVGLPCGPTRLPLKPLDANDLETLQHDLEAAGWLEWFAPTPANA